MNEKVLIEAKSKLTVGKIFYILAIVVFAAIVFFITLGSITGGDPAWMLKRYAGLIAADVIVCVVLVLVGVATSKKSAKITVYEQKVIAETASGKRVELPISQISTVGTGTFKRITLATSSGTISISDIPNRDEVYACISTLLEANRSNAVSKVAAEIKPVVQISNADELKKYKELLDTDVITQEEFEAKKKQLLGL